MAVHLRIALIAAASFLGGFGVAELTGVRALGGVVLLAGAVWCAREALPAAGRGPTAAILAGAFVLFVLSHLLGHAIGAWPAVLLSSAVAGLLASVVVRRSKV